MRKLPYVEDNDDSLYMLQLRCDMLGGYEVLSVRDGAARIVIAASERPDLFPMDPDLPEIDGWDATRRLKTDPATRDIPNIALSPYAMVGDQDKALATGLPDRNGIAPLSSPRPTGLRSRCQSGISFSVHSHRRDLNRLPPHIGSGLIR